MPSASPNPSARWLQALLLLNLLLYLLPFALVRSLSFERWGGSYFGPALDYPFTLDHTDADILIFGDSSAVVGINPRQLSSELGLKAINLPNTGASLQVIGEQGLDHYLAHNKPPRLLVFYFAPWNLDYAHQPLSPHLYEGEEVLLRRGSLPQVAAFARREPLEILNYPWRFYAESVPSAVKSALLHVHPAATVAASGGYLDPLQNRPALPAPCTMPDEQLRPVPHSTAAALLQRYHTPLTEVAFVLAPLPACTRVEQLTLPTYRDLRALPPVVLPPGSFKQDFAYIHLRPEAVKSNTTRLATLLRAALDEKPAAPGTVHSP